MTKGAELIISTTNFNRSTKAFFAKVQKDRIPAALKKLVFEALNGFIAMTPVASSRAEAGWYAYLDANGASIAESGGEGADLGRSEGTFEETITADSREVVIINRVPYILLLEFGRSNKAPDGMVRVTMQRLTKAMQEMGSVFDG